MLANIVGAANLVILAAYGLMTCRQMLRLTKLVHNHDLRLWALENPDPPPVRRYVSMPGCGGPDRDILPFKRA